MRSLRRLWGAESIDSSDEGSSTEERNSLSRNSGRRRRKRIKPELCKELNLCYITDQIIVGGSLSDAQWPHAMEAIFQTHLDHFLFWNFESSDQTPECLHGQVLEMSFDREKYKTSFPPLDQMLKAVMSIQAWCSLDADHVAVLYCENGRRRTGIVMACYFLYARLVETPMEGFGKFFSTRLGKRYDASKFMERIPPSLVRYMNQFQDLLEYDQKLNDAPMMLKAITIQGVATEHCPLIQIIDENKEVFNSNWSNEYLNDAEKQVVIQWDEECNLTILFQPGIFLNGDFILMCSFNPEFWYGGTYIKDSVRQKYPSLLFRYSCSTWFVDEGLLRLPLEVLDITPSYLKQLADEEVMVELNLQKASPELIQKYSSGTKEVIPFNISGHSALAQGILEITKQHSVLPDTALYRNFIGAGFDEIAAQLALQRAQNEPNYAVDILHRPLFSATIPQVMKIYDEEQRVAVNTAPEEESAATIATSKRPTTAQIVCNYCGEDDILRRNQLIRCISCDNSFHTFCVNEKSIPFKLTSLRDRKNHATYISKKFSLWICPSCDEGQTGEPAEEDATVSVDGSPETQPTAVKASEIKKINSPAKALPRVSSQEKSIDVPLLSGQARPNIADTEGEVVLSNTKHSPTRAKFNQLQDELLKRGVSVDDLLRSLSFTDSDKTVTLTPVKEPANEDPEQKSASPSKPILQTQEVSNDPKKDLMAEFSSTVTTTAKEPTSDPRAALMSAISKKDSNDKEDKPAVDPRAALMSSISKNKESDIVKEKEPTADPRAALMAALSKNNDTTTSSVPDSIEIAVEEEENPPPEELAKYISMLKYGVPLEAVRREMNKDSIDASLQEELPKYAMQCRSPEQKRKSPERRVGTPLDKEPEFEKYFRMIKCGIPRPAIKQKMVMEGVDPDVLDMDPSQPYVKPTFPLLKDVEKYQKFFKMLKVGMPLPAAKHAMIKEGLNPDVLDLDPEAEFDEKKFEVQKSQPPSSKKKKARRRKVHLKPISVNPSNANMIWNDIDDDMFDLDMNMVDSLFINAKDNHPSTPVGATTSKNASSSSKKKIVSLIDRKRATNVAIALARIKCSFSELSNVIATFDSSKVSSDQLTSLEEFLPDAEEKKTVLAFKGDVETLGEAEKFFLEIIKVPRYQAKIRCLNFRNSFKSRVEDLSARIKVIQCACDDVTQSKSLMSLLGMVRKLSNRLNSDEDGEGAASKSIHAFTMDSLLALSHTKAVNKKSTALDFLVQWVMKDHAQILSQLPEELKHVDKASRQPLSILENECKRLANDSKVLETELRLQQDEDGGAIQALCEFAEKSVHDRSVLEQQLEALRDEATKMLSYFGEEESKPTDDFFGALLQFSNAVDKSREQVVRAEKARLLKQRQEQDTIERRLRRSASASKCNTWGQGSARPRSISKADDRCSSLRFSTSGEELQDP